MLDVLSVAYALAPVDADPVGGAEQVVTAIDRALVEAGHRSTVLAQAGSRVEGRLVPIEVSPGELSGGAPLRTAEMCRQALVRVLAERHFDVVHFHGCDCGGYLPQVRLPRGLAKVVTLHVPTDWYDRSLFEHDLGLSFVSVSAWQREHLGLTVQVRATIENGVDLQRWQPLGEPAEGYALCLGRICPEKGFDRALRAAHAAQLPLLLAGQVFPYVEHQRYFAEEIAPLLDDQRRFIGPVSGSDKRRWLARARCLIVPSRVPETSSLVTMEALACGTPVIVSGLGAPASLIEPGITGLIAGDESELAAALLRADTLDRRACRRSAEARFDVRQTTRGYIELYRSLVADLSRPRPAPFVELFP